MTDHTSADDVAREIARKVLIPWGITEHSQTFDIFTADVAAALQAERARVIGEMNETHTKIAVELAAPRCDYNCKYKGRGMTEAASIVEAVERGRQ